MPSQISNTLAYTRQPQKSSTKKRRLILNFGNYSNGRKYTPPSTTTQGRL